MLPCHRGIECEGDATGDDPNPVGGEIFESTPVDKGPAACQHTTAHAGGDMPPFIQIISEVFGEVAAVVLGGIGCLLNMAVSRGRSQLATTLPRQRRV